MSNQPAHLGALSRNDKELLAEGIRQYAAILAGCSDRKSLFESHPMLATGGPWTSNGLVVNCYRDKPLDLWTPWGSLVIGHERDIFDYAAYSRAAVEYGEHLGGESYPLVRVDRLRLPDAVMRNDSTYDYSASEVGEFQQELMSLLGYSTKTWSWTR